MKLAITLNAFETQAKSFGNSLAFKIFSCGFQLNTIHAEYFKSIIHQAFTRTGNYTFMLKRLRQPITYLSFIIYQISILQSNQTDKSIGTSNIYPIGIQITRDKILRKSNGICQINKWQPFKRISSSTLSSLHSIFCLID